MTTVLVNGINLNTLGYQVDVLSGRRVVPIRQDYGLELPGLAGSTVSVGPMGSTLLTLEMWVDGVDPTTGVHTDPWATFEANLSQVASAFVRPSGLVTVSLTELDGIQKVATGNLAAYVVDEDKRRVRAVVKVPRVFFRGASELTFTSSAFGSVVTNTELQTAKSNAPISDAVITVNGPATNPVITDTIGGQSVNWLSGSLASGEKWELDIGKRLSRKILTGGGASSVMPTTVYAPMELGAPIMELWPSLSNLATPYQYRLTVTASGTTGASSWSVKAKPAYL